MNKKIYKNKKVYTDLAIELVSSNKKDIGDIFVTDIKLDNKKAKLINKKPGYYLTVEFNNIELVNFENLESVLKSSLLKLIRKLKIKKADSVLIVGLGNNKSICDSLGPRVINKIKVTRNISTNKNIRKVSCINTSVMGKTGIETSDIITSIVDKIKPNLVIVIDSLKTSSLTRLNKTIQITDTGIHPGSGVGNKRKEISFETLNTPVLALGVPTVIDLSAITIDTINTINKNYVDIGEIDEKMYKLMMDITDEDMIVTPKEIDNIIDLLSEVISNSINEALHNK